jgi:DNA-directed RNA polymerase subunit RPC12/RpoP
MRKPAEAKMSREDKIHEHNSKIKDPQLMINPGQYGYKSGKPNAIKDFHEKRKKFKGKLKDMALKKALTAGYGGSGAPGALTGGGVMQSEALDDGRKDQGFEYITCENCGHEQVFMSKQVKCRECKQNFSLSKLKDHM